MSSTSALGGLHPERRGLLASPLFDGQPTKGIYFFPGESDASNVCLYTAHPTLAADQQWTSVPATRGPVVDRMIATHANTIMLSYWGDMGRWSPMAVTDNSPLELLEAAASKPVVVMPAIESGENPSDPGPQYNFADDFPYVNGELAPKLWARIEQLIALFDGKRSQWAQIYDRDGAPRYAIHLLHVGSKRMTQTYGINADDMAFAAAFDAVADGIGAKYGLSIGFTLDLLPPTRSGPSYVATPAETGALLETTRAVLAVQGFASEVWSMHASEGCDEKKTAPVCIFPKSCLPAIDDNLADLPMLVSAKRTMRDGWIGRGLPVILDVSSGFDGRWVWMANGAGFWGDNALGIDDRWRNFTSALKGGGIRGITFNTWNGYTEGYAATPTREHGTTVGEWLTDLYAADPRVCDHVQYEHGKRSHHVYGAICEKWAQLGAYQGFLGGPRTDELPSPGGKGRILHFDGGAILWGAKSGAYAVNGIIGATYASWGFDQSCLGLPIADEGPYAFGGRISRFQGGTIAWLPGDTQGRVSCPKTVAHAPPL